MAVSLRSGGLRAGSRRSADDNYDPMSSVGNIADAMLVFAVALMMALLTYWNLELPTVTELETESEISEVQDIDDMTETLTSEGSAYKELGTVYYDPSSNKMYMLTENLEDAGIDPMATSPSEE